MINIDELMVILDEIKNLESRNGNTMKDKLRIEAENMYAYHALQLCLNTLNNKDTTENKEGIKRTKSYFERIEKVEF